MHSLTPARAHAGLDLTWRACNLVPGNVVDETLQCDDPSAEHVLYGCFQLPAKYSYVEFMDVAIDFETPNATLSPFWHFEAGGCNEGQLRADIVRGCPSGALWPWTRRWHLGALDYQPGYGGANRARLSFRIYDDGPLTAQTLQAGANYFAFALAFDTARAAEGGGPCQGCADSMVVTWSEARISTTYGTPPLTLDGPGLVSQCVTVNGASPQCAPEAPTSVRNGTWGALKVLYR